MEQARRKDVHMTVPETGGYNQAFAVNNSRIGRDLDGGAWPNGKNAAIVCKDRTIFDWRFSRRGINLCTDQGKVIGMAQVTRKH
jgi:hypothetical protein